MKPIKILALIFATVLFHNCTEEKTVIKKEIVDEKIIKEEKTVEIKTEIFTYNSSNGYIESITTLDNNDNEKSYIKYEYNNENRMVKFTVYNTKNKNRTKRSDNYLIYDNHGYVKTHKQKLFSEGKWKEFTYDFEYEINGSIINIKETEKEKKRYTYEYNNGNLSYFINHRREEGVLSKRYAPRYDVITNDNHKNPYYKGFPSSFNIIWIYGKNNITEIRNSGCKNVRYNNTITYQYDYNSEGFPTKKMYYDFYGLRNSKKVPIKHLVHYKYVR